MHAGGFALREQSAYGQGVSFAGVAAGGSLSSMFWNPATLSQVMGFEIEAVGTGVFPISDVMLTAPVSFNEGDIGKDAFVPATYIAYRLNDNLIFGVGVNGAFGLSTEYNAPGSPIAISGLAGLSDIFSVNVNPNVAYQINDYVTIAAGSADPVFGRRDQSGGGRRGSGSSPLATMSPMAGPPAST